MKQNSFQYKVFSRMGTMLAGFMYKDDALEYAKAKADSTHKNFRVVDSVTYSEPTVVYDSRDGCVE